MGEIIKLREAIALIWETVKTTNEQGGMECPYVFVVGSGISAPEILTAGEIIQHCQDRIKELYGEDSQELKDVFQQSENLSENSAKYYSYWFGQAYKNKKNRQQYLKTIINNARISTSNLLLAQILNAKKIATTVITPNFDNHLLKSLNLLGNYDVFSANNVLDNIALNKNSDNIQIMHVHGTYEFYDCCNLENEIIKIASEQGIKTTAGTIEEFLKSQSPIVIGYSGWEDDVIMSKLKERIEYAALPYKWLWFCFTQKDYEMLPNWLKKADDVNFILPDLKMDLDKSIDKKEKNPMLPAADVLNALISIFKFEAPYLFSNPIQYYIDLINGFLPENIELFPVKSWKRKLNDIDKSLNEIDRQVISLDAAAAKKDIVDITKILKKINYNFLLHDDLEHILKGVLMPLLNIKNRIENTEELYEFLEAVLHLFFVKVNDIDSEQIELFMREIILIVWYHNKKFGQKNSVKVCDKVLNICNEKGDCKILYLAVLGTKADLVDKEQGITIRDNIIEQGKHQLDNEEIARVLLIATFKQIKEQKIVLDNYKNIINDIKEKHKNNKDILEFYYSNVLGVIDKKINIDISIGEIFNQININELSSDVLLEAYKVYCNTEEDINNKIKIAMDAIERYDIDNINGFEACSNYAFLLGEIVIGKINLKETIQQKYIEYSIDLCHKKESYPLIKKCMISMLKIYIGIIKNQYEKKELCKKLIEICNNSKLYEDWTLFHDIYFVCMEKKEQDIYLENNEQYKVYRELRTKMSTAIAVYVEHNIELCKNMLLEVSKRFDEIFEEKYNPALINICFMLRRGEIPEIKTPALDMINKIHWMDEDAFFHINKALIYIMQSEWEKAREEIRKIEYSIEEAIQWWSQEEVVGKKEKAMVFMLLVLENKIDVDYEIMELLDSCMDSLVVPDEIKQEINEININLNKN